MWDLDDWVLDAHLIRADDFESAAAGTCEGQLLEEWKYTAVGYAHNVVEIWDFARQTLVSRYCCEVFACGHAYIYIYIYIYI